MGLLTPWFIGGLAALGIPSETPEDLQAALFSDGVSTAACVTDISGRGIGMGAVHAAGTLSVISPLLPPTVRSLTLSAASTFTV